MKQKRAVKMGSLMLTMVMALRMGMAVPVSAMAADIEMEAGTPTLTVNSTTQTIGFGGQEWYVIGYNGTGIYSQANTATLLHKGAGTNPEAYGNTAFHSSSSNYLNSTLQGVMSTIAANINTGSPGEYALINPRTLTASDDANYQITGGDVDDQRLWPLSYNEWDTINDGTVRGYGNWWWLRSPSNFIEAFVAVDDGSGYGPHNVIIANHAARPALNLNLTSVLFTSAAAGGKSKPATAGASLSSAEPTTGAVKLTVLDNYNAATNPTGLSLNVVDTSARTAAQGSTVSIGYTGAQTGTGRSVSVLICDTLYGTPLYYGRPVDLTTINADGTASFTVPALLGAGSYRIQIFNEEVNGDNETDFASTPINISLTITARAAILPVPKTGDDFPFVELTALMAALGIGAYLLLRKRRAGKRQR